MAESTRIRIYRNQVEYELGTDGEVTVRVEASIPVHFPIIDTWNFHDFEIEVSADPVYGGTR